MLQAVISATIRSARLLLLGTAALILFAGRAVCAPANAGWFTRTWQTDDGVPNNSIVAVAQTRDGFLWVGTSAGLAQFDGIRFTEVPYLPAGADPAVRQLFPSRSGGLWIVPEAGPVVCLNPDFSKVSPVADDLPNQNVIAFAEEKDGTAWIGFADGLICQVKGGQVTQFTASKGAPNGTINALATDNAGHVWLAKGGIVCIFKNGAFNAITNTRTKVHLAASKSGGVWVTAGLQLLKCNAQGEMESYGTLPTSSPAAVARTVIEDHTGAVWIGTDGDGLFRYAGSNFEAIVVSHLYVSWLIEDFEGNIWAGTLGGGLNRVFPSAVHLEEKGNGPSSVAIQSVCEDANGVFWGATENGEVVCRTNDIWVIPDNPAFADLLEANCVAADDKGAVWFGAHLRVCCWSNNFLTTWDSKKGMSRLYVSEVLPASNGDVWLCEYGSLTSSPMVQRLRGGKFHTFRLPQASGRRAMLAETSDRTIWIGTSSGLLLHVEQDAVWDATALTGVSGRAIRTMYATPDGSLWIGYAGLGLGRLKNGRFMRITVNEGLPVNYISQIVADNEGWLWFGGDRGIFKLRQRDVEAAMNGQHIRLVPVDYGRNEGLPSVQADFGFLPAPLRSRDGRIWIPTRQALAVADPRIAHEPPEPTVPLVTRVVVDGETIAAYGTLSAGNAIVNLRTSPAALHLGPAHRKLQFEFSALDFSAPENVRFRYRLEGLDVDWLDSETRSVSYSRLPAGDYQFHVQATDGYHPWKDAVAPLALTVTPFFWQTWWFRGAILALFTSAIIAIVWSLSVQRHRRLLRTLEQQAALDKERARIARDLHDDLGCSLTRVALNLDMVQRQGTAPAPLNEQLHNCIRTVRHVAKSVEEIVWAISPRNDTLRFFIDYTSEFAVDLLHAAEISCRVDLPDNTPDRVVPPDVRHNFFLVMKEALNNIIRHAHATEVRIRIGATPDQIVLAIEDNGCGFTEAPDNPTADGLRNMRQRMEEIGGTFSIESAPGSGTRVTCTHNISRHD